MTITEQFWSVTDEWSIANRDDIVSIEYTTGNIDGTESHAVRRTTWVSGNVNGTQICSTRGRIRPISLGHAETVTCRKCLKHARRSDAE